MRSVLVVGQVALSLVLLVGATLFFRSLQNLSDVEPGFDATGLVAFTVSPPYTAYGTREAQTGFHDQLMGRMQTSGTVRRVGAVSRVPLAEGSERGPWALDPGDEQALDENRAEYQVVLPGYFQTMEIPLLSGRYLDERDQDYSDPTVVIDELLAERIWPGQDAVGRTLAVQRYRPDHRGFQVVPARVAGVVQSVRVGGLESPPRETIYVPLVQRARPTMTYTVQSGLPTARFEEEIRDLVASVDPSVPVHEVRTVDSYAADALSKTRALLGLGATLSGLAVLLSAMGIFGLVSHAVRGRAHELGIRLALGAEGPGLVRRAVGESLALVAGGLLVGLLATLGLTPLLESQLFGVPARDLGATLAGSAVLLVCALVSSWIPARRISGIDPAEILTRS